MPGNGENSAEHVLLKIGSRRGVHALGSRVTCGLERDSPSNSGRAAASVSSCAMAKPTANLRLFVSIEPPPDVATAFLEHFATLQNLPPHATTAAGQVHLTLQFIGDVPARNLDDTIESVQRSAAGLPPFELRPMKLISLPERGPARLVAAETDAPATLMELHNRLAHRLARSVRDSHDQRFRPHMTLCRFRSPARGVRIEQNLDMPPFAVREFRLMRSTLIAAGAKHHPVMSCALSD